MEQNNVGTTSLFLIEPHRSTCTFRKEVFNSAGEARERALSIPLVIPAKTGPRRSPLTDGLRLPEPSELSGAVVVLGSCVDPLLPFDENFDCTVSILKQLAESDVQALFLQTRSPILVILLPLLQSFGRRLTVVFGIETTDDGFGKEYLPEVPLASERLKAATVLSKFGIPVIIQTTQLPALPYANRTIKHSVAVFAQLAEAIRVVPFDGLFTAVHLARTPSLNTARDLIQEIENTCPEKLAVTLDAAKRQAA